MRAVALTILLAVHCLPISGDEAFFRQLDEIYITVLADSMPKLQGQAFSISIFRGGFTPETHQPIPDRLWRKLSAKLKEQGIDITGYVSAERVQIRNGTAYESGTQRRLTVWSITGIEWLGDSRIMVSKRMFRDGLTGQFYTAVLEHTDGRWVVKARTNQGVAHFGQPLGAANSG